MLDSLPPQLREQIGIPAGQDPSDRDDGNQAEGDQAEGNSAEGSGVTLLQLSTTFCAPCRHTRILLDNLAKRTDGLRHVEIDLTHHPEWSTPLEVHQTPTTLALDADGHELFRVRGVPRRAELADTLRPHLPEP